MKNRKFKFRAWDDKNKKFPLIGFNILGEATVFDLVNQYNLEHALELQISQFTGLHDKNGKDIYEGDVYREEIEFGDGELRKYYVCTYITELGRFAWLDTGEVFDYETL